MNDVVAVLLAPEQIREATAAMCVVAAFMIGPFLAFAVTQDAGVHCFLALVRLIHRVALVLLSIALMYWASFIVADGKGVSGPAFLVVLCLFFATAVSGLRHALAPPVPRSNTWRDFRAAMRAAFRPGGEPCGKGDAPRRAEPAGVDIGRRRG